MQFTLRTIQVTLDSLASPPAQCKSTRDAVDIMKPVFDTLDRDREHFAILALDPAGSVNGYKHLFSGGQCSVGSHVREVVRAALLLDAQSVVVFHNHPTNDATPSQDDFESTAMLIDALRLVGVECRDHVIMGADHARSMRFEKGFDFNPC